MVLPQGGSTFVSGGEYSPPTGWLDKPLAATVLCLIYRHIYCNVSSSVNSPSSPVSVHYMDLQAYWRVVDRVVLSRQAALTRTRHGLLTLR